MKLNIVFFCVMVLTQTLTYVNVFAQTKEEMQGVIQSGQYDVARKMALQLINKNDSLGFNTLGWLESRKNTPAGDTASFDAYLRGAELGDKDSLYYVGIRYKYASGTAKDIKEAVYWLEKAAIHADVEAMFELAEILSGGYDYPSNTHRAMDLYGDIYKQNSLVNTEIWLLSAFRMGLLLNGSTDEKIKILSDSLFATVLQSNLKAVTVKQAQSKIQTLVAQGKSKAGQGDGSPDDALCQKYGFTVNTQLYAECRMKIDIAKNEARQRQALYDAEMARYNAQVAEYEKQKKREESDRLIRFGLALMGGTSPNFSENLNNANRAVNGLPPVAPQVQNFNIITPRGGLTSCTIVSNNVICN